MMREEGAEEIQIEEGGGGGGGIERSPSMEGDGGEEGSSKRGLLEGLPRTKSWQLSIDDFTSKKKDTAELKGLRKPTSKYYKRQNALVELFEQTLETQENNPEAENEAFKIKVAIYGSFAVNVCLCIAKIYAAIVSGSLAVLASAIDSVLDLLSGSIIFITAIAMKRTNPYKYPAGKTRMEPLGVIIFAACMFTAALQILVEGIRQLLSGGHKVDLTVITYVIIGVTVGAKLILFLYCRLQTSSSSALALANDHKNDVLTNVVGLGCAIIAYQKPSLWWFDPAAGMLMGLYIMFTWFNNGFEQVKILSGSSADKDLISKITFLCWNHHPKIVAIDTVRAFHLANGYMVEIDIVLPRDTPLQEAHDIGESLQVNLEKWEEVERCFVHLDYEFDHKPEHKWIGGKTFKIGGAE